MPSTRNLIAAFTPDSRRGFLRQLTTLPLIGGGLTIIGGPTAVAEPVKDLLHTYSTWLFYERRMVCIELARGGREQARMLERGFAVGNASDAYFFDSQQRWDTEPPSGRAALVLSAVGCNWRDS